jgi:hypothetical protein
MEGWLLWFFYWILSLLGLLWVKRNTDTLRCNAFSAAIAATVYIALNLGGTILLLLVLKEVTGLWMILGFLYLTFGLIPTTAAITLFLGNLLIPFFKVKASDFIYCTLFFTGWMLVAFMVVTLLHILGFLLMASLSNAGMPRPITRFYNDRYYW